jgi:hypothetical protein
VALLFGLAEHLTAQGRYRVMQTENFRREPTGRAARLATVNAGAELAAVGVDGRWVNVVLEGWVWARSLDETTRAGFALIVTPSAGENLRSGPNGSIVARVSGGALFEEIERQPGWVHVRRAGWMFGPSLEALDAVAAEPDDPEPEPVASLPQVPGSVLDYAVTAGPTELRAVPDGDAAGTLAADRPVRIVARSGEWVRVQTDGWVREADLAPAAPGVLVGVSGAEVRARPSEFEGKVVQWTVQFIAVQDADEIRRDIPTGSRYLLARGPLPETGFVYVVLTDEQADALEREEPLAELVIVGQIRKARSHYLGNPVLNLVEVTRR